MAIIKQLNKKTGITYVYESHSYRDKETKQPRSERKLLGRLDETTGEIIPTRKKQNNVTTSSGEDITTEENPVPVDMDIIREKDALITEQRREIARLRKEKAEVTSALENLLAMLQK